MKRTSVATITLILAVAALADPGVGAQQPAPAAPAAPPTPRAAAPIDLTGYWVSVVTEDWRWRMLTPPKGDYLSVPLNPEGRKTADTWDPAQAASNGCKPYGAAAVMRAPGRLHVTWDGDATMKIETDAGQQTRLLRFEAPKVPPAPSRQGLSIARWQGRASLTVDTSRLIPGYLQTNGVPYSANATMEEHFDVVKEPNGEQWLIIDTIVTDPTYLFRTFVRSTHFKKEADGSKWDPQPCIVKW